MDQIDPSAPVWRIYHHLHCPARGQDAPQRTQAGVWVGQVVQDAGGDDVVKFPVQIAGTFDGQLYNLQIVQAVLLFQLPGFPDACLANIDADDPCFRPAQGMLGGLRRAATGD